MAKKKKYEDPPKRKSRKSKGVGMSGSTSKTSQAELNVAQRGLSGKQNVSSQKAWETALMQEQDSIGEKKTSYTDRKKGNYTGMDTATGKRSKSKAKKQAEKTKDKKLKAQHKRAGMSRKQSRTIRKNN